MRPPLSYTAHLQQIGHKVRHLFNTYSRQFLSKKWRGWIGFFFLILTTAIIGQIIYSNWETFRTFDWQLHPEWGFGILFFFLLDLLIVTWAWHLVISKLANFHNLRLSAKICWSSNLARRIPGPVWYIAGRALLYEKHGVNKKTTTLLSGLELGFLLVSGLVTTLLTLPFWILPTDLVTRENQMFIALGLIPLIILFVHPRLFKWVWQKISRETLTQPLLWRDTIQWLLIYILTWVVGALVLYSLINLIYPLSLTHLVELIGVWSLGGSISLAGALTISFIGLREISLALLLVQIVPGPVVLIVAIGIRIVWILGEFLSALIAWRL